ncbi:hypothetical protein AMATHDRAFT_54876 [Amanita thiersii Skay4041]|uniref:Protein kinase domain-containing protein n=1 Tax=Amanita thiersii Skay4041 TaxID=703135 RepID=A0A2A9NSY1_9AGAR|nr:hypothetical protein AMATHDRAFT_54876 [Amanita thiersii Skay4041]
MAEVNIQNLTYPDLTGRVRKITDLYFAYGGFSEVYRGVFTDDQGAQHFVAIKIIRGLHIDKDVEATIMRRLNREARVWHTLIHPNVLPFLGVARNLGSSVALISPFCTSGNISKYLDDSPQANRLDLIRNVARGVEYLHSRDVIHGDIKGPNILVTDNGMAVLCDFGRSRIINHRGFTTAFAGSARYMAPELISPAIPATESDVGDEDFDPSQYMSKKSDVYSFSMVGIEILSGERPYPKIRSEHRVLVRIPEGLRPARQEYTLSEQHGMIWQILEQCWVAEPSQRPTMSSIVEELTAL